MQTQTLQDGSESFEVSVHEAARISPVVLFAVGAGGKPERHATLLDALAKSGCTVVAPHFERLASPVPSEVDLTLRARRLSLALDAFVQPGTTAVGVGHSIGAATLVALAGAQMWLGPGRRVNIAPDGRLTRLALLAPPTGFFQAPEALDSFVVCVVLNHGRMRPVRSHCSRRADRSRLCVPVPAASLPAIDPSLDSSWRDSRV